ncbi:MAG: tetratricopeptide repeat protein [bacterium]|nr:tetratricopeptide repeat protein [bacterium]MDT8366289.1 tetratricopeptide repeat protein [bacterium]
MDTCLRSFPVFFLAIFLVLLPVVEAAAKPELFPLSPGSTWTYRNLEGDLETLAISQVSEKKGIPLIAASYDGNKPFYYILGSEGLFRLQPLSGNTPGDPRGELTLLLRWPLDPGQTWQSPWSDPPLSFTVLDRGPVRVAAGDFHDCIKVGYRPTSSPIYQGYIWFKPGIGLLAQEESAHRTELVSYSQSDLLSPPPAAVTGNKLADIFKPPKAAKNIAPTSSLSRVKDLLVSAPFYLFILLIFLGIVAGVSYLNTRKVEMDLQDDPDVQEGETTLASAMVREGLYKDASEILQRLTAKHPQWPDLAALLGKAYREMGQFQEACLEYKRALALNPAMAKVRLDLVKTYLSLSEPARALEEVETVLAENQGFADAIYLKGEALAAMGLEEEALRYFREALKVNPSFTEAQNALERMLSEGN